uniref:Uncharacterized protein n=1 Tax=Candidatus Kentrum sp. UNK TaxID=2126344 RepID=A0A451ADI8_9GAMM|nr:MAG: hypothetical protein BECKUNK1418G_GA0071005_10423 [Candidatus Kentron sp. UNK]VFK69414.1 MAG: hypothetical protein BECKUNK1418H_GA0071006_101331 [Candidatus Kentron sp. UNK]
MQAETPATYISTYKNKKGLAPLEAGSKPIYPPNPKSSRFPWIRKMAFISPTYNKPLLGKTGTIKSATMLMILMSGLMAGPAVSL